MGQTNRERARGFTATVAASRYAALFERLRRERQPEPRSVRVAA